LDVRVALALDRRGRIRRSASALSLLGVRDDLAENEILSLEFFDSAWLEELVVSTADESDESAE
jgi:hypothetical protein